MKKTNYIGANKTNEAGKKYIEPIEPQAGILKAIAGKLRGKTGTSATCPYSLQHCWESWLSSNPICPGYNISDQASMGFTLGSYSVIFSHTIDCHPGKIALLLPFATGEG